VYAHILLYYISSVHAFIAVMQYVEHVLETVSRILCVSSTRIGRW